jgi:cellulose synthase/poly-beta-1,6-N-acetylglucosamine synthase-like glycosyltransferase
LFAAKNGYTFKYVESTIAYYKLPSTLKDHLKKSSRFFSTSLLISKCFNKDFVNKELEINLIDYIKASILAIPILINYPFKSLAYFIIKLFISYKVSVNHESNQSWDLAYSTK